MDDRVEQERRARAEAVEAHARGPRQTLLRGLARYLWSNKKWWLLPVILALLLLAALAVIGTSGVGPFVYPLF